MSSHINTDNGVGAPTLVTAPTVSFSRESVLTIKELAAALRVSRRTIERSDLPRSYRLGHRTPRFVWGEIIDALAAG